MVIPFTVLSFSASRAVMRPGSGITMSPTAAHAAEKNCDDCDGNGGGESSSGALCAFKYLVFFFWYACMAVVFLVAVVMDLTTGFTQDFTKDFTKWFIEKDRALSRFFRAVGCP
jgi:hypothetical protein